MSDYVPSFEISSPVLVDEDDVVLAGGGGWEMGNAVRLGRMSPKEPT